MKQRIALRPVTDDDREFIYRVYAGSRLDELARVDWDDVQKEEFLRMQFDFQCRHYDKFYADADFNLILVEGRPVGRLYVDRWPGEIRIVDIAVLPEARNRGVGTALLEDILNEGREKEMPVSIHVEQFNPAMHLYQRLGFEKIDENGVYHLMEWRPEKHPARKKDRPRNGADDVSSQ